MLIIKRIFILATIVVLLATLVVSGFGLYFYRWLHSPVIVDEAAVVVVPRGESFVGITRTLLEKGIIDDGVLFRLFGRFSRLDRALKAGEYRVPAGMTHGDLAKLLASGVGIQHAVTLVEGRTLQENLKQLQSSQLALTGNSERQTAINQLLTLDAESPEGLFFADTYHYEWGNTDVDVLRRAHDRLMQVLNEEWAQRMPDLPYNNAYEALILASMIERETAVPEERPIIAGVFVRRLRLGMRLQSDPTVIYGMGDRYNGSIRRSDLKRETDWNTYTREGLPKTPISLVGREAIRAALNPAEGKALYFVAKGDGTHAFNNTLADHNRAVHKYQRNRISNYRSTPLKN